MEESIVPSAQRRPNILFRLFQWLITAFFVILLIVLLAMSDRLTVPNAPILSFVLSVVFVLIVAIAHCPPIFFKLSRRNRYAAYAGMFGAFTLFVVYTNQAQAAFEKTPEGRREAALRRAEEANQAIRDAQAAAARSRAAVEATNSGEITADPSAAGEHSCSALVPEVIEMSKGKDGPQIIEINAVETRQQWTTGWPKAECTGMALTDRGQGSIDFGSEVTPQGNEIVTLRYPHGLQ